MVITNGHWRPEMIFHWPNFNQLSFTILILIVLYPCLSALFRSGCPVNYDHVPKHVILWASHYVTKSDFWCGEWFWQKSRRHIFRDSMVKLKTSRILTSILLSDPVRDQTSIFKVTSCLITSSKTQPKSTESRKFFADSKFSLFFSKLIWKFLWAYLETRLRLKMNASCAILLNPRAYRLF